MRFARNIGDDMVWEEEKESQDRSKKKGFLAMSEEKPAELLPDDLENTIKFELEQNNRPDDDGINRFEIYKRRYKSLLADYADKFPNKKKLAYLAVLSVTGKVLKSALTVGISMQRLRTWRGDAKNTKTPLNAELFCKLEEESDRFFDELLLSEIDRRAVEGVREPIYYAGEKVGEKTKYSDNLLMFRTKARLPQYRESHTQVNINNEDSGDIEINFQVPEMNQEVENKEVIDVEAEVDG